jgi:hypothetical protein
VLVFNRCFDVQVWGNALDFAHLGSSSHCNVFLTTLGTMCHLSLGVWTNIMSVFLFVLFTCFVFFFFCMYIFVFAMYIKKFSFCLLLCC